jgi:hypothetical protein
MAFLSTKGGVMGKVKGLLVAVVGVVALVVVVPTLGLAGPPAINDHGSFTEGPYDTYFCGVPGTEVDTGVFHVVVNSDMTAVVDTEVFNGVFTAAATGRSIELSASRTVHGTLQENGDGTGTISEDQVGLVLKFKLPNGPVLKDEEGKPILGAGILDTKLTIDLASGDVLSVESTWHGPHPLRDGVDICGPAIAYLTS